MKRLLLFVCVAVSLGLLVGCGDREQAQSPNAPQVKGPVTEGYIPIVSVPPDETGSTPGNQSGGPSAGGNAEMTIQPPLGPNASSELKAAVALLKFDPNVKIGKETRVEGNDPLKALDDAYRSQILKKESTEIDAPVNGHGKPGFHWTIKTNGLELGNDYIAVIAVAGKIEGKYYVSMMAVRGIQVTH
jgi:hypothetical protein